MELISILNTLWSRRIWVVLAAVVATSVGLVTAYKVSLSPFALKSRSFDVASATTQVLLDSPQSALVGLDQDIGRIGTRTTIFASLLRSGSLTKNIAERANLRPGLVTSDIDGEAGPGTQADQDKRADQLVSEGRLYRLSFDSGRSDKPLPLLTIRARAPSVGEAERLADAATTALKEYVDTEATRDNIPATGRLVVQQLQPAEGGMVTHDVANKAVLISFFVVFGVLLMLIVVISGLTDDWRLERVVRAQLGLSRPQHGLEGLVPLVQPSENGNGAQPSENGDGTEAPSVHDAR